MVADERHRQLRQIDISRYGRSLFWLQRANFFVLVFSLSLALAAINVVAQSLLGGSYPSLIAVVQCVISMGVAFVAWKTVGKIEPRVWPFYLFLFFFGALFYWSFLIALLFSAPTHNFPLFREAQGAILVALSFTLGMPAALTLSRAKIGPDKLPISRITSWLKERIDSAEIDVAKVDKINRPVGWAYRIAGILTLFLGYEHLHRHPDAYSVAVIMVFFGTALLIRSRRYFQIKAELLLRSDSRRPIFSLDHLAMTTGKGLSSVTNDWSTSRLKRGLRITFFLMVRSSRWDRQMMTLCKSALRALGYQIRNGKRL